MYNETRGLVNKAVMTIKYMKTMLRGKLNRRGFFFACISIYIIMVATYYLLFWIMQNFHQTGLQFIEVNSIFLFIYFVIFILIVVRRLNDINATIWWSLIFCADALFSLRNIVIADVKWGIHIDPFSMPIVLLNTASLILFIVLLFKPSSHNTSLLVPS
jgi:uncharacterized membrane protein YhaH (DUF805 family)